jgi:7-cyano-7-deazaguanine synthase
VPEGHYADENMKATVVPNRNAIMLSIAWGIAVSAGAWRVGYGAHAGDHPIYPDCRPEFTEALEKALVIGNEGFIPPGMHIWTPWLGSPKSYIVKCGRRLRVPFEDTWSCYKGGALHCGKCGTCVERQEAFMMAGLNDPTIYEEPAVLPLDRAF